MARDAPSILASAGSVNTEKRLITLTDATIGVDSYSLVAGALLALQIENFKPIVVLMHDCPGGMLLPAFMMHALMRASIAPVYTIVERCAASAAVYIFLGGSKRLMVQGSRLFTHQMMRPPREQSTSFMELAEIFSSMCILHKRGLNVLRESTKVSQKQAECLQFFAHVIAPQEAKRCGFATQVISKHTFKDFISSGEVVT